MRVGQQWVESSGGWSLDIRRCAEADEPLAVGRRPVVMIPGYGMNTHVLREHPSGPSLAEVLCGDGLEVWTANLRGQGDSYRQGGRYRFGMEELALHDLPAVIDAVLERSDTGARQVDLVGCSLGATLAYIYLAHHPDAKAHRVGALVNIGGPLRWNRTHPLVRLASQWPELVGMVPVVGVRQMAALLMPLIKCQPWILSIYMNPAIIDLSRAEQFLKTIDDPNPGVSQDVAAWIKQRDLNVGGLKVSQALFGVDVPIQCVIAGQDGIVTPEAALSILDSIGSHEIDILEVGTPEVPYAHADLFISKRASEVVFEPVRDWLKQMATEDEESYAGAC